jgi:hypothetical protein
LQQFEVRFPHDQVLESNHAADAAIAVAQQEIRWRFDFEAYAPAMTPALMCGHNQYPASSR